MPKHEKIETTKNTSEITIFNQTIKLDKDSKKKFIKTIQPKYNFTPKDHFVNISQFRGNEVIFTDKKPSYHFDFKKPVVITKIEYIRSFKLLDTIATVTTPLALLGQVITGEEAVTSVSTKVLGIYRQYKKNRYRGYTYNFTYKDRDKLIVRNPFGLKKTKSLIINIEESYVPSIVKSANNRILWNPGKFIIDTINPKDIPNIIDYALRKRHDRELNEKLIASILKQNKKLFNKLKKNHKAYNLPNISYFNLPNDVDLQYAQKNKFRIFQNRVYKNTKGKIKAFALSKDLKVFDMTSKVSIKVKQLDIHRKKATFNKKDEKKTSEYIDFSKGI